MRDWGWGIGAQAERLRGSVARFEPRSSNQRQCSRSRKRQSHWSARQPSPPKDILADLLVDTYATSYCDSVLAQICTMLAEAAAFVESRVDEWGDCDLVDAKTKDVALVGASVKKKRRMDPRMTRMATMPHAGASPARISRLLSAANDGDFRRHAGQRLCECQTDGQLAIVLPGMFSCWVQRCPHWLPREGILDGPPVHA